MHQVPELVIGIFCIVCGSCKNLENMDDSYIEFNFCSQILEMILVGQM